ncbi:MAG: HAD-IA family hydrolase [Berryella intestinalis]|uniref:HAD-IA family hydrolase n=1 Tax=Berryella intestinalis TaxID=1531429 RepID=UPI002A586D09|nr:HAD-IA family hydrolase [Berryella intestinalis]MDD7368643.1 HAD-IA family hydrolase [Berryella intestinalis]MDY3129215.1 HAD-IA family hydrolase [Berryella intestinalis]
MVRAKAVLFDNDGTLVDTAELLLKTFRYATRTVLNREFTDEQLMRGVGIPLASQMYDFTDDADEAEELLRVYRAYNKTIHDDMISVFPGIPELLLALQRAGIRLGVVTSKRHDVCQHGLEICGIADRFEFVVGSDDCSEHKPQPGPVLYGCELLGVDPSEAVYVGDSPYDILAGRAAGVRTLGVTWGVFSRQQIAEAAEPTFWAQDAAEAARVLGVS